MTTRPKAVKFRIRRSMPLSVAGSVAGPAAGAANDPDPVVMEPPPQAPGMALALDTDENAIRREGLTGRQLRMARRVAQKHGLAVASDYDAVAQLRARGIDPFQMSRLLELVQPQGAMAPVSEPEAPMGRVQLPQTVPAPGRNLPSTERAAPGLPPPPDRAAQAQRRSDEIMKIQRDIARRRRRKLALLFSRLAFFVMLPTFLAGWYFYTMATPMYATRSEFVIQQSQPAASAAGLGGLFQGTSMATQQDSITVQSYLTSRAAFLRLDQEYGFKAHFAQDFIDPIQRLDADASNEEAYALYQDHVRISYDPTEGIVKMEVIAADPQTSQQFSEALVRYAEEQVDQLSLRLREDQMAGARDSYEEAEARRAEALANLLAIQESVQQIDGIAEGTALISQISALETERQQVQLQLEDRLAVARPNQAQVDVLRARIANIESLIADLRAEMTASAEGGASLAQRNTELRQAEEDYAFQTVMVQAALTQMETARIEANRQVRYLETGVAPVAPDEATYPRAFENTVVAFMVFAGIYLMLSLTASILREQVTS